MVLTNEQDFESGPLVSSSGAKDLVAHARFRMKGCDLMSLYFDRWIFDCTLY